MQITETFSPEETFQLGKELASKAQPGQLYTLVGDLGTGKTVLTQGIAKGLGIEEPVSSPTACQVEEMDEIGYEDYFYGQGLTVVEWADLIAELLPGRYQEIKIEKDMEKGFDYRKITIQEVAK